MLEGLVLDGTDGFFSLWALSNQDGSEDMAPWRLDAVQISWNQQEMPPAPSLPSNSLDLSGVHS